MTRINLEFIRARRILLKLTLQDMADALGFKYAANYMMYERGEYKFKANHIPALAQKLECEIDDLFTEGGAPHDLSKRNRPHHNRTSLEAL